MKTFPRSIFLAAAIGLTFLSAAAADADEPQRIFGEALSGVSADGTWVAGQIEDGSVIIRNLATDEVWTYFAAGLNNYYIGYGSPVSNIGVVAGATTTSNAAYWENGKWTLLPVPNRDFISNAVSVTPDGSIICGGVGMAGMGTDTESTMLFPALWYRQADGTYSDPLILPHPDRDLTGRAPQYISAIAISDDGKTVAGEITDYFGAVTEPLVYICDNEANWTCRRLGVEMLNPSGIVFPEWPGGLDDDILMPTQEWYMTPEQIQAFIDAFNDWDNTGDPPRYEDFMTPEQIAEYQEAMQEYLEVFLPWQEDYNNFMQVYMQYARQAASFARNGSRLSPDGKLFVTGSGGRPVIFNLDNDEVTLLRSNQRTSVTCITADYSILAYVSAAGADIGTYKAYIYPQMAEGGMLLEDYIRELNPDLYDWMEEYLLQEVIIGLNADDSFATQEMLCTGIPVATPDLAMIVTNNSTASWLDTPTEDYVSVLLPMDYSESGENAVEGIMAEGAWKGATVYSLEGNTVCVLEYCASLPELTETLKAMRLAHGVYVAKTKLADGTSKAFKISL